MNDPANPFAPPTATIDAPPAAAAAMTPAERGQRFVAILLDGLCAMPVAILLGIGAFMIGSSKTATTPGAAPSPLALGLMGLGGLYLLGLAIYQIVLLSTRGQTIGKRWMQIKIVKLDGSPPGFVGAVLLRIIVNSLIGAIPYVGVVYSLVDILVIFRDDRRCLHDQIAGTRVVMAG
jgi:uncharacterized RDD family membrane protein YckC